MRYLTHPEVDIDPERPVGLWRLSKEGRTRTEALARMMSCPDLLVSSAETKAVETAAILAGQTGATLQVRPAMHENDRSSTGFLEAADFEYARHAFFGAPEVSFRGWERAVDAQARIVAEVNAVCATHSDKEVVFVGHGAVGTLLYCDMAREAISAEWDQGPGGGGNWFSWSLGSAPKHHWRAMEEWDA
ncbi:MAG: histidine phosphatase family protein [Pseudomonadota bacterium]